MVEVRCFHSFEEAEDVREQIDALNIASAQADPFSSFGFLAYVADNLATFGGNDDFRPWLVCVFDEERLLGYAPLKQQRDRILGFAAVKIDWLAAYVIGRPHLVALQDDAKAVTAAVYRYLFSRSREWSMLNFEQQDVASPLLRGPVDKPSTRYRLYSWPDTPHWVIPTSGASLQTYFKALSVKMRSNVSRQMRGLMAAGDVELITACDPETVGVLFDLYRGIESHSWKPEAGVGVAHDARSLAYYQGLMADSQPMRMTIQILLLDGVPVAGMINGGFGRGLYALEMAYDTRVAHVGAGTAMMLFGIRRAIEEGFDFYDLLRGFGHHKARWQADMVENASLQIYRNGSPYDWRRSLGNMQRAMSRVLNRAAAPALRRLQQASAQNQGKAAIPDSGWLDPDADGARRDALVVKAEKTGEVLTAAALASAMPFPVTELATRGYVKQYVEGADGVLTAKVVRGRHATGKFETVAHRSLSIRKS